MPKFSNDESMAIDAIDAIRTAKRKVRILSLRAGRRGGAEGSEQRQMFDGISEGLDEALEQLNTYWETVVE